MQIPENLLYTENHEWVLVEEGEAIIGITDYAQQELGDVVFVDLPEVGEGFVKDDDFAVIESVKAVSDIFMPVSGNIVEINEDLFDQPELINNNAYENGWLVRIKISDESELDDLMDNLEYTNYLEEV